MVVVVVALQVWCAGRGVPVACCSGALPCPALH